MKLAIVSDVWLPLANCIVTTLQDLTRQLHAMGHEVLLLHPGLFTSTPCPGYPEVQLSIGAAKELGQKLDAFNPDAIHLATEGLLGWQARSYCMQRGYAFTSSYHSRFPEKLQQRFKLPLSWGFSVLRQFHSASSAVMVPVHNMLHVLQERGFKKTCAWTHAVDSQRFPFNDVPQTHEELGAMLRPVSLFVGNLNGDKNIEEFLEMDVPGTKVVCGEGPMAESLRSRYPSVRWLGHQTRQQLAKLYACADVFVMPAKHTHFSLVMLEALSCGVPVAAHPTLAAKEILGEPAHGGAINHDLVSAWYSALAVPRHKAFARSQHYGWQYAALMFLRHLVPKRAHLGFHKYGNATTIVTKLSSKY